MSQPRARSAATHGIHRRLHLVAGEGPRGVLIGQGHGQAHPPRRHWGPIILVHDPNLTQPRPPRLADLGQDVRRGDGGVDHHRQVALHRREPIERAHADRRAQVEARGIDLGHQRRVLELPLRDEIGMEDAEVFRRTSGTQRLQDRGLAGMEDALPLLARALEAGRGDAEPAGEELDQALDVEEVERARGGDDQCRAGRPARSRPRRDSSGAASTPDARSQPKTRPSSKTATSRRPWRRFVRSTPISPGNTSDSRSTACSALSGFARRSGLGTNHPAGSSPTKEYVIASFIPAPARAERRSRSRRCAGRRPSTRALGGMVDGIRPRP